MVVRAGGSGARRRARSASSTVEDAGDGLLLEPLAGVARVDAGGRGQLGGGRRPGSAQRPVQAEAVAEVDAEQLERAGGGLEQPLVEGRGVHGSSVCRFGQPRTAGGPTSRREAGPSAGGGARNPTLKRGTLIIVKMRAAAAALGATSALLTGLAPTTAADVPEDQRTDTIRIENSGRSPRPTTAETCSPRSSAATRSTSTSVPRSATGPASRPGDGTTTFVQTRLIGDFDAGETKSLAADQNCLTQPFEPSNSGAAYLSGFSDDRWQCLNSGNHAPFTITARVLETDTSACGPPCTQGLSASKVLDKRFGGDDDLGAKTISFSRPEAGWSTCRTPGRPSGGR